MRNIFDQYELNLGGAAPQSINPHDARRTYARLMYEAGVDIGGIQQNLGHVNTATTWGYIGTLDSSHRVPDGELA